MSYSSNPLTTLTTVRLVDILLNLKYVSQLCGGGAQYAFRAHWLRVCSNILALCGISPLHTLVLSLPAFDESLKT